VQIRGDNGDTPRTVDPRVVDPAGVVTGFAAYVEGSIMGPAGDMRLRLGVPFNQIPHVMPLVQQVGGIVFEVTVRKVPVGELPEPGW